MKKMFCRVFQSCMKIAMYCLPWTVPEVTEGPGSAKDIACDIKNHRIERVLIVTGPNMIKRGLPAPMLQNMRENGIEYKVFDNLTADPTDKQVEEGVNLYKSMDAGGIVLFGGGAPMDCGKAIAARIARYDKSVNELLGVLKVRRRKKVPIMWAVPTTSGTGSEATMAAVITDSKTHRKKSINDVSLIPHKCVLDAELTCGLPADITANTGMDALCHAIEAYTNGTYNTKTERELAKKAVKLIYDWLYEAYKNGTKLEARQAMQRAAFYAGRAFTRGCVGYVHAIGHTIGGLYGIPHGKAMAVLLPHVMACYGKSAEKKLAELAEVCGIAEDSDNSEGGTFACNNDKSKAEAFIEWIRTLNRAMGIPEKFSCIKDEDIPLMAEWADKEANPLYPVPKIFGRKELKDVIESIREA